MFGAENDKIPSSWGKRADAVREATTEDFAELIRLSGLNPKRHLRLANWSGVDFSGCDLRGFDLSGARLRDCDFAGALIEGARFDQAEINGTDLRMASDWDAHMRSWRAVRRTINDRYLPPLAVFQDAPFAPEMVAIPAGKFLMGSAESEEGRYDDEGLQHEVTIAERVAVGRYPVTFEEWDFAAAAGGMKGYSPKDEGWGRGRRPVIHVDRRDARAYAAWLSRKTGKRYSLLSEAEWEYCCRAGSVTRYAFGDDERALDNYAWHDENSDGQTHPVGEKQPNGWGLYDMHGNVWEWCEDRWHESYGDKPEELKADGGAWTTGDGSLHVVRGGSWGNDDFPRYLRSACRDGNGTDNRNYISGFRVARTLTS